jgi:hypothetical protein
MYSKSQPLPGRSAKTDPEGRIEFRNAQDHRVFDGLVSNYRKEQLRSIGGCDDLVRHHVDGDHLAFVTFDVENSTSHTDTLRVRGCSVIGVRTSSASPTPVPVDAWPRPPSDAAETVGWLATRCRRNDVANWTSSRQRSNGLEPERRRLEAARLAACVETSRRFVVSSPLLRLRRSRRRHCSSYARSGPSQQCRWALRRLSRRPSVRSLLW